MARTVLSVLALSGALVLGACGTQSAGTGAGTAATAASASAAGSSSKAGSSAKVGDLVPLKELATRCAAAVKAKGTAHLTTKAGASGEMEADVDFRGSAPKMSMTTTEGGETVRMVYLDKVIYLGGDSMASMSGGKPWVKISAGGDDLMSQLMGPLLTQMQSSTGNPAEQLKAYGDVDATVKAASGGVTTYTVRLTRAQLEKAVQTQTQGMPGLSAGAVKQLPVGRVSYDLALDANNLPLSLTMDLGTSSVDVTYSKWGDPVRVTAPPASEVGTFRMPTG